VTEQLTLNDPRQQKPRHEKRGRARRRSPRGPGAPQAQYVPLNEEGFPAALPDAPRPSPAVFTTDAARALYPWLPGRVIAGSVWRGPAHVKVRIDANGDAHPWPKRAS
jgi:hypothetical protein